MLYEPTGYIIEYEICAVVFFLVIMVRFFMTKRFPNRKNQVYAFIMWVVLADMILDIASSLIIDNVFKVPLAVTYTVNILFYFLQILLPLLMTVYTLTLAERFVRRNTKRLVPLFIPGMVMLVLMLLNSVTHRFFFVDENGYNHGDLFIITYLVCFFYMVATAVIAFVNRSRMRRTENRTVFVFLAITFIAMAVQFFYPELLITGVAIALAVVLMYFTIQNPENMIDTTTGAFTYDAMLTFLQDRLRERERFGIVAIKIHNMPRINELLGIENGSVLLSQLNAFMREGKGNGWVFRMRGSCFVSVFRNGVNCTYESERLYNRALRPWTVGNTEVLLQATVCCIETDPRRAEQLTTEDTVRYLETAFAQYSRSDDRVVSVTVGAELREKVRRRRDVEVALREALDGGEGLELYFQPLWSPEKKCYTSAEALLRFRHPVLGNVSPAEFVPIAENNGLVTAMDEFVVRKVCAFISENRDALFPGLERIEINLSALEFMQLRLPALLSDIMTCYGVDPSCLCFEITETAATESFDLLKECMNRIGETGCSFALDDFGTGYANVSQVIRLPFSVVKLDKSLLYGSPVMLEDISRMFRRMNRQTVMEGVETVSQVKMVETLDFDYIQGFYYALPMKIADFLDFLKENEAAVTAVSTKPEQTALQL